MNRSTPDLPVQHQLPEPTQTHVHWVSNAIQPSHPLSLLSPPALNLSQHQGLFQYVSSLYQVAKVLEFQLQHHKIIMGFPDSLVGKESSCNAGDPGLIPGLGRPPGEGIDYPLQYSWASLVAQLVKNSPAMQETWVQSLGWEDPLEKGKVTHSSILPGEFHGLYKSMGSKRVGHNWANFTHIMEWLP